MNDKSTPGLGFWTFAALASLAMLYLNNQKLIDHKILPEIKRVAGIPSTNMKPVVIVEKTKPASVRPAFRPLPESITPVYVESEEDKERRKKLGLDTKDPGYCTSEPCTTN